MSLQAHSLMTFLMKNWLRMRKKGSQRILRLSYMWLSMIDSWNKFWVKRHWFLRRWKLWKSQKSLKKRSVSQQSKRRISLQFCTKSMFLNENLKRKRQKSMPRTYLSSIKKQSSITQHFLNLSTKPTWTKWLRWFKTHHFSKFYLINNGCSRSCRLRIVTRALKLKSSSNCDAVNDAGSYKTFVWKWIQSSKLV